MRNLPVIEMHWEPQEEWDLQPPVASLVRRDTGESVASLTWFEQDTDEEEFKVMIPDDTEFLVTYWPNSVMAVGFVQGYLFGSDA